MISSRRKPGLTETHCGIEFYNSIFPDFLNKNNIKHYSRNTFIGVVFAERFNRTFRNLLKRFVFERSYGNWIDILPTKTKHYNSRVHTSINLFPIHASLKKNESFVYNNLLDKRKRMSPKFKNHDSVWVAALKKRSQKEILLIGLIYCKKVQKKLLIQNRVVKLTI